MPGAVDAFANLYNAIVHGESIYNTPFLSWGKMLSGEEQMENTQESLQQQIDYEQYLKAGNERALADWNKNVGSQGKTIKYPELSYAGQIRRADTSIARAGLDYDTAAANYYGNVLYRGAGLYGIGGRFSRFL